ncbi:MAG: CBS domain-containing protein [Candidatus Nanopelagicales bacterium]
MATPGVTLGDVMSAPVFTVEEGESLWDAWQLLLLSGLRHIAVIDVDGAFISILSDRMILANAPLTAEALSSHTVGELLGATASVRLAPDASPVDAARLMSERSLEAIAVLDSRSKLVGIVTETDLVRWLLAA